jgi:hypothetical protein
MNTAVSNRRLQIATRIHFALLRELGIGIDVGRLLKHPLYARDVLLVCDACTLPDLPRLATAFRGISQADAGSTDGTGSSTFGLSQFSTSQFSTSQLSPSQFAASQFDVSETAPPEPTAAP